MISSRRASSVWRMTRYTSTGWLIQYSARQSANSPPCTRGQGVLGKGEDHAGGTSRRAQSSFADNRKRVTGGGSGPGVRMPKFVGLHSRLLAFGFGWQLAIQEPQWRRLAPEHSRTVRLSDTTARKNRPGACKVKGISV